MTFSEPWEYQGKVFVKCKDCNKSMLKEWQGKHNCKPAEPKQSEVTGFKPATEVPHTVDTDQIFRSAYDLVMDKVREDMDFWKDKDAVAISTMINTVVMAKVKIC